MFLSSVIQGEGYLRGSCQCQVHKLGPTVPRDPLKHDFCGVTPQSKPPRAQGINDKTVGADAK